jgi:hypothetical protein
MEACYGGTGVMERSCAMARGKDINNIAVTPERTVVSVGEWPLHITVVNCNRFTSETVA